MSRKDYKKLNSQKKYLQLNNVSNIWYAYKLKYAFFYCNLICIYVTCWRNNNSSSVAKSPFPAQTPSNGSSKSPFPAPTTLEPPSPSQPSKEATTRAKRKYILFCLSYQCISCTCYFAYYIFGQNVTTILPNMKS